ncbi:MAG: thiamine phosphate synthase [Kofleriaceae bacterium]
MTVRAALRGFYAVLDRPDLELASTLLAAGARVLQLRIKPAEPMAISELIGIARRARAVCRAAGAALIVNDRIDVALAAGADGVHLGQRDLPLADARRIAGGRLWIGISTHDLAQVAAACAGGADYLGYGPVFATRTKLDPDPVQGVEALRAAVAAAGHVPVVAIGGITAERAADVYAAGASAVCAISAVNDAPDVGAAARRLSDAIYRDCIGTADVAGLPRG